MTFKLHSTDDGHITPWEQLPCSGITPVVGLALYQTSGKLAIASGANLATYICQETRAAAVTSGTLINVVKIQPDQVWETQRLDTDTLAIGTAYDVGSGGLTIDGTTNGANFRLDYIGGAAAGDTLRGRFIK